MLDLQKDEAFVPDDATVNQNRLMKFVDSKVQEQQVICKEKEITVVS
jgi:hypothetical protein